MNEIVINLIEKAIYAEYDAAQDLNFSDMTEAEKMEYNQVCNKMEELQTELENVLTEDQFKLFMEYSDTFNISNSIEQRYMFNRGVKNGLNKLNYIREELKEFTVLL